MEILIQQQKYIILESTSVKEQPLLSTKLFIFHDTKIVSIFEISVHNPFKRISKLTKKPFCMDFKESCYLWVGGVIPPYNHRPDPFTSFIKKSSAGKRPTHPI